MDGAAASGEPREQLVEHRVFMGTDIVGTLNLRRSHAETRNKPLLQEHAVYGFFALDFLAVGQAFGNVPQKEGGMFSRGVCKCAPDCIVENPADLQQGGRLGRGCRPVLSEGKANQGRRAGL